MMLPAAAEDGTSPTRPKPMLDGGVVRPSGDITGSIETRPPTSAPSDSDATASGRQTSAPEAEIAIPAPDLPALPVIDASPVTDAATTPWSSDALAVALKAFVSPDQAKRLAGLTPDVRQRLKDRQDIAEFYAAHAYAPLWIEDDHLNKGAQDALGRVDRGGEDGLDLAAYAVPALMGASAAQLAETELAISEAVVAYAKQSSGSRVDPLQIDRLITAKPVVPAAADVLAWLSVATDKEAALRNYNPPQRGYAQLRAKLAELRQQETPVAKETIPSGPTLRPGMRDARVPLIRARFGLDLPSVAAEADGGLVYDTRVAAAVADFQRANGLPASGLLTSRTIAALSGGNPSRLENELIANMERWRWMPRDLGADHIMVNVPDFSLAVTMDGTVVHRARVVVGKPDHQTPIFSDLMRFIIVNPYWNVPLSIIKKEMMPKLAENPNYFEDHGYEVVERDGATYVRQPPGDDNALGRIKFMFPNQHSVYLHDTNARALFGKEQRAFSHGCVRVDQPFKLAEVVLGKQNGWSEKRVRAMIGGDERTINLPKPLPIHIAYFTSFVDEDGGLQLRDDVYGYSSRVKTALGLRD